MRHTDGDGGAGRVAAKPRDGERRPGLRALGGVAAHVTGPIIARQGGGRLSRLKTEWPAIAGAAVAAQAWPMALSRDGALRLRVAPGAALDLQHRTPLLIERVNLFFGHPVVTRIALVQGPLPLAATLPAPAPNVGDSPTPAVEAALTAQLAGIADPALRAALVDFARLLIGRRGI